MLLRVAFRAHRLCTSNLVRQQPLRLLNSSTHDPSAVRSGNAVFDATLKRLAVNIFQNEEGISAEPSRPAASDLSINNPRNLQSLLPASEHSENQSQRLENYNNKYAAFLEQPSEHTAISDKTISFVVKDAQGKSCETTFDFLYLRDLCFCPACANWSTKQKSFNSSQISKSIQPKKISYTPSGLVVQWNDKDNHISFYPQYFLARAAYNPAVQQKDSDLQSLWDAETYAKNHRSYFFKNVMTQDSTLRYVYMELRNHGIVFIKGCPPTRVATRNLCRRVSIIRDTHYGGLWDVKPDLKYKDTAYTLDAIDAHSDTTYFTDPCGLMLFHVLEKSGKGGESTYIDGFKAAAILKELDPASYDVLSKTLVSGVQRDQMLRPLYPTPILQHHPVTKKLIQVRYNNADRELIHNLSSSEDCQAFYKAIRQWESILSASGTMNVKAGEKVQTPDLKLVTSLEPGTMVLVNNTRVLHGRTAITGYRRYIGAYLSFDDLRSRHALLVSQYMASRRSSAAAKEEEPEQS